MPLPMSLSLSLSLSFALSDFPISACIHTDRETKETIARGRQAAERKPTVYDNCDDIKSNFGVLRIHIRTENPVFGSVDSRRQSYRCRACEPQPLSCACIPVCIYANRSQMHR